MLHKKLKLVVYGGFLLLAAFSCKKNDPTPAANPAEITKPTNATPLSTADAKSQLESSATAFNTSYANYTTQVTSVTSIINSLRNNSSSSLPSSLAPSLSSFRFSKEDGDLLQALSDQLGNLQFLGSNSASGKIIPLDFASAKGTWEMTIETISGYNDASSSQGEYAFYCNFKYYKRFLKQTSTVGDAIVIKFPAYSYDYYSSNNCVTTITNNAVYTISALETTKTSRSYCDGTTKVTKEYDAVTKIVSSLKIDDKEVMTYEFSTTYANGTAISGFGKAKIGIYEYSYVLKYEGSTASYEISWSESGVKIYGVKNYIEVDGNVIDLETSSSSAKDCSANTTTTSNVSNNYVLYKKINKYDYQYTYGGVTIYISMQVKDFINKFQEKYAANIDANGYLDTAGYSKLTKDTVLVNAYYTAELFKTDGSAKIGKLVSRYETTVYNYGNSSYSSSYKTWVYYIVYNDGTSEKLSNRFSGRFQFYFPTLVSFIQTKYY